jgi:hypothetical protein
MKCWSILFLGLLPACFPEFEDRTYLVDEPTILAIRSTPAELRPGAEMSLEALVVSPNGTLETATLEWSFCLNARRAEERTSVTASCLAGDDLQMIESTASVLDDACFRFGSVPPPSIGDEQPLRPSDPDPTGGYFLPVRAAVTLEDASTTTAFGFVRIRCDLTGATRAIFDMFQERYTKNVNPTIGELVLGGQTSTELRADAGASVSLTVRPSADTTEPYVVYSAVDGALYDRDESLRANWYVSGGTLSVAAQTLAADEIREGQGFETQIELPPTAGEVHGWVVVRDDRGGADWSSFTITTE